MAFVRLPPSLPHQALNLISFSSTPGETIGYIGRIIAHSNQNSIGIFILQTVLLLIAPALFAASIYMVLGRLMIFVDGAHLSLIRPSRLTKIFVIGDVLSFLIQSGGGSMMSNAAHVKLGQHVILFGLVFQILFFGLFIVTSVLFHYRIHVSPTPASLTTSPPWTPYIYVLYFSSGKKT